MIKKLESDAVFWPTFLYLIVMIRRKIPFRCGYGSLAIVNIFMVTNVCDCLDAISKERGNYSSIL